MSRRAKTLALAVVALAGLSESRAASYLVPPDRVLVEAAALAVRGRVLDGEALRDARGAVVTDIRIAVESVLRGRYEESILTVRHPGGVIDDTLVSFPGTGTFRAGERVLLLLERTPEGHYRLFHFALGKFDLGWTTHGMEYVRRDDLAGAAARGEGGGPHRERMRALGEFERFIRRMEFDPHPPADYFRDAWTARPELVSDFELITVGGGNFARWQQFDMDATVVYRDDSVGPIGCPGGCHTETGEGVEDWNAEPGSNVALRYGGTDASIGTKCINGAGSLQNEINYDDPCNEISDLTNCGGTLALGGFAAQSFPTTVACPAKGSPAFWKIVFGAIMVNNGVGSCLNSCDWEDMIAHEAGHSLGFDHTNVPGALMAPTISSGRCGVLQADDIAAAQCVYTETTPPPLSCNAGAAPASGEAPLSVTFSSGAAGGTPPYTHEWDFGDGTSSTSASPVHVYGTEGSYVASVEVTDSEAGDASCSDSVEVTVTPCVPRVISAVIVKEKTPEKVKVKVIGTGFQKGDRVQIDSGSGWQDAPRTVFKSPTKLIGKDVAGIFPDNSTVEVRVAKANGCAGDSLPASR